LPSSMFSKNFKSNFSDDFTVIVFKTFSSSNLYKSLSGSGLSKFFSFFDNHFYITFNGYV